MNKVEASNQEQQASTQPKKPVIPKIKPRYVKPKVRNWDNFIIRFIRKHKLHFETIFVILLMPTLYSEIYDYQYYKYFSKVPPAIALMVWAYRKVEKDEDHQTFLPLLGLTFSIIAEFFWMFDDEVTFIVGSIQFLSSTLFIGLGAFINICSEKTYSKIKPTQKRNMIIISFVIVLISIVLSEINAQTTSLSTIISPFWYTLAFMVICYIWRYKKASPRSYQIGLVGAIMYFISDLVYCFRRVNKIKDWLLNLIWISSHYYGTYFLIKSVVLHMDWYFEKNIKKKEEEKQREYEKWKIKQEKEEKEKLEKEKKEKLKKEEKERKQKEKEERQIEKEKEKQRSKRREQVYQNLEQTNEKK